MSTFILLIAGCGSSSPRLPTRPRVVVSTSILGDIVEQTVKGQADVEILVPRGVDPGSYLLTERQRDHVQNSPLIVVVGFNADPDLGDLLDRATRNGNSVIEAAPRLNPRPLGTSVEPGRLPVASAPRDPHFWIDPDRVTQFARTVADHTAKIPGVDREAIGRQSQAYADQLARADEAIQAALLPVPDDKRVLVTQHDVLGYFSERYSLKVAAVLQPDPDLVPTAAEVDAVAAKMRSTGARVVLTNRPPVPIFVKAITDRVPHAEVVMIDLSTLGPPGSETDSEVRLLLALASLGSALMR